MPDVILVTIDNDKPTSPTNSPHNRKPKIPGATGSDQNQQQIGHNDQPALAQYPVARSIFETIHFCS